MSCHFLCAGKTTQLPQYLHDAGYTSSGGHGRYIGVTQPRRVAATSVARRVAEEMGCALGSTVGYKVRFDDTTSESTAIKFMTDGMLVREAVADPMLSSYSVLMLDEAHERSVSTDVLLGLVKRLVKQRSDLRVLVTSATLDTSKFVKFFGADTPVVLVPGRTHPVAVFHSKVDGTPTATGGATMDAAIDVILRVHKREPAGDILVFLTGQEEIDRSVAALTERAAEMGAAADLHTWSYDTRARAWRKAHSSHRIHDPPPSDQPPRRLLPLPLYGALSSDLQQRVFAEPPADHRKVVFATNIAETSVTVNGIRYVVDPGFVKEKSYDVVRGMEALQVVSISQNAAMQRAGRAGRTGPGKCFRLFTKASYDAAAPETTPEIARSNLTQVVLLLKALGVHDVLAFPFLDPPAPSSVAAGLKQLFLLGALTADGVITEDGRTLTSLPLDPALARMLVEARALHCLPEALTLAALLGSESLYWSPPRAAPASGAVATPAALRVATSAARAEADMQVLQARASMYDESGDHVTYVQLFEEWVQAHCSADWARAKFLSTRALHQAKRVRSQLAEMLQRAGHHGPSPRSSRSRSREAGHRQSASGPAVGDRHRHRSRSPPRHPLPQSAAAPRHSSSRPAVDEFGRQVPAGASKHEGRYGSSDRHSEHRGGRRETQSSHGRRWEEGGARGGRQAPPDRTRRSGACETLDEASLKSDQHRRLGVLDKETRRALVRSVLAGYYPQSAQLCAGDTYKLISGSHGGAGVGEDGLALDRRLAAGSGDRETESYQRVTTGSTLGTQLVFMHPSSALSVHAPPPFVVFHELVSTNRPHMRTISAVKSKHLLPLLPRLDKVDLGQLCGRGRGLVQDQSSSAPHAASAAAGSTRVSLTDAGVPQSSQPAVGSLPAGFFDGGSAHAVVPPPAAPAGEAAAQDAKAAALQAAKERALARAAERRA